MEELNYQNIDEKLRLALTNNKLKFNYVFKSNTERDTFLLGNTLAKYISKNSIFTLNGELGSGKTVLVKAVGKYFGIQEKVSSPTFTIVNEYTTDTFNIYHFDVYRLSDSYNFMNTIGTDYFSMGACFIEWGKLLEDILPRDTINIDFEKTDENLRTIKIWRK